MEKALLDKKKNQALKKSIAEGSAMGASTGFTSSYITPLALKLGAKDLHIGILSSFVGLLSPMAQLYGSKLLRTQDRKKILLTVVLTQALLWLPIALLALLKFYFLYESMLIYLLIIFYSLVAFVGGLGYPSWFSWMGDLISKEEKGKYFARRNVVVGVFELLAAGIATLIIEISDHTSYALLGFAVLFILASLSRLISYKLLGKIYYQKVESKKYYHVSVKDIIKHNKNYKRFAIYHLFFNLALMIASPFFAVYMLKELNFSYVSYIIVSASGGIFYLLFTPLMGKISDKYGNVKLLLIANVLFAVNPILWIFIKSPLGLTLIPQVVSGLANAAMIISVTNFSYDYLKKEDLGIGIAYSNLAAGIGVFIGSILGGLLLDYLNIGFMNNFIFLFLITAFLRAMVAIIFLPKIKETRKVQRLPQAHISILHPFRTIGSEISWVKSILK